MNGGIPAYATSTPLQKPAAIPMASAAPTASGSETPFETRSMLITTPRAEHGAQAQIDSFGEDDERHPEER